MSLSKVVIDIYTQDKYRHIIMHIFLNFIFEKGIQYNGEQYPLKLLIY